MNSVFKKKKWSKCELDTYFDNKLSLYYRGTVKKEAMDKVNQHFRDRLPVWKGMREFLKDLKDQIELEVGNPELKKIPIKQVVQAILDHLGVEIEPGKTVKVPPKLVKKSKEEKDG